MRTSQEKCRGARCPEGIRSRRPESNDPKAIVRQNRWAGTLPEVKPNAATGEGFYWPEISRIYDALAPRARSIKISANFS